MKTESGEKLLNDYFDLTQSYIQRGATVQEVMSAILSLSVKYIELIAQPGTKEQLVAQFFGSVKKAIKEDKENEAK